MKLFHLTRQDFAMMGIYDCGAFNWRNLLFLVATLKIAITTSAVIVMSRAESAAENAFAFYQAISALAAMFATLVCIWKRRNFFALIHSFESFIEKSQFSAFF